MLIASFVGTVVSFIVGIANPRTANKAGPDWLWMGGRDDVVRNLFFQPNGSFRRYGLQALVLMLIVGSAAVYWIIQRI
jgi:uncharacterized membrane protein YdcZ (DUF606 family)